MVTAVGGASQGGDSGAGSRAATAASGGKGVAGAGSAAGGRRAAAGGRTGATRGGGSPQSAGSAGSARSGPPAGPSAGRGSPLGQAEGARAKLPVYPCTDERALVTRPFCGLLVSRNLLESFRLPPAPVADTGAAKGAAKSAARKAPSAGGVSGAAIAGSVAIGPSAGPAIPAPAGLGAPGLRKSKHWTCWLCSHSRNELAAETCAICQRPRAPEWLRLVGGRAIEVGDFCRLRRSGATYYGLVTQLDYRQRKLQLFAKKELPRHEGPSRPLPKTSPSSPQQQPLKVPESKEAVDDAREREERKEEDKGKQVSGATKGVSVTGGVALAPAYPEGLVVDGTELAKGNLELVWAGNGLHQETGPARELALSLCDYLLCGDCGSVSKLSNGRAVLDNEQTLQDKAGRLRGLLLAVEELDNKAKYLARRWRQSKKGYDEMNQAQNELAAKETQAAALRAQLAPFQFWCSSCGWRWPESRPMHI